VRVELLTFQAQVLEQVRGQGLLGDFGQILGRDDLVGIDVVSIDKGRGATKLFHRGSFLGFKAVNAAKRNGSCFLSFRTQ
jgi:hypothetical protein